MELLKFHRSDVDQAVFYRRIGQQLMVVLVHVDDCTLVASSTAWESIHLSQRAYIQSILRRYNLQDLKPLSIPMDPSTRFSTAQAPSTTQEFAAMRDVPYHEAVGSLMYAALGTRPDIAYAVQTVSRFSKNPGLAHWEAVKRVFRYRIC